MERGGVCGEGWSLWSGVESWRGVDPGIRSEGGVLRGKGWSPGEVTFFLFSVSLCNHSFISLCTRTEQKPHFALELHISLSA